MLQDVRSPTSGGSKSGSANDAILAVLETSGRLWRSALGASPSSLFTLGLAANEI